MISNRYRLAALGFWPGLPQIWTGQVIFGLVLAAFFTVLVNLAVVSRWVYVSWMDPATSRALWAVTALTWAGMAAWTVIWVWKFHPERYQEQIETLYRQSAESYLQGRWAESRDALERLIVMHPSDTEALLRLARLLTRTGDAATANRVLAQCRDTPGAGKWAWEIVQVQALADRMREPAGAAS